MTFREPPPGWSTFGSHVDSPFELIFSEETGDDGLPLWEQPVLFYDKQGKPLAIERADELLGDMKYKQVALDKIGPYVVSTVWLGVDHGWDRDRPPVIFETMVFGPHYIGEIDVTRYRTEDEARTGHEEVCTLVRATYQPIDTQQEEPRESENR